MAEGQKSVNQHNTAPRGLSA